MEERQQGYCTSTSDLGSNNASKRTATKPYSIEANKQASNSKNASKKTTKKVAQWQECTQLRKQESKPVNCKNVCS